MRLTILLLMVSAMTQGCDESPKAAPTQADAPRVKYSAEQLKALEWIGDADRAQAAISASRHSNSGYWGEPRAGRREMISAAYFLRENKSALGELGFPVVDATPLGLRLKVFEGLTFMPDTVRLDLALEGQLDAMSFELAHDKIAVLTWHEAAPRLTVYAQSDGAVLWSAPLSIKGWRAPLVLGWHPHGELVVEWRGEEGGRYERAVYDGATGDELGRERLDARIEAALADPVTFILAAPADRGPVTREMSAAERAVVAPPQAMSACPLGPMESAALRAERLDGEVVMTASAPYFSGGREPGALQPGEARCAGVVVYDFARHRFAGRWVKLR